MRSRARFVPMLALAVMPLGAVAACNAITGVGDYDKVNCSAALLDAGECDLDGGFDGARPDGGRDGAGDVFVPDVVLDGYVPVPAVRSWARYLMPNPADAGAANAASYQLLDGGTAIVKDLVTKLEWERSATPATSRDDAEKHCRLLGNGFVVPTRIELVTLLDSSQRPTIATAFDKATAANVEWTASPISGTTEYWGVDFQVGAVADERRSKTHVRCVRGVAK